MAISEAGKRDRRRQLDRLWDLRETRRRKPIDIGARRFLEESMHLENPDLYPDEAMIAGVMDWFIEDGLPAWEMSFGTAGSASKARQRRREGLTTTRSGRPGVYGGAVARRLCLLSFVAERCVPFSNLVRGSFDTAGRSLSLEHVLAEWNQAHPDKKMSLAAFARAYRRLRHDEHLLKLYFDSDFRDWARQAECLCNTLSSLGMAGLRPEDVFVRFVTTDGSYEPDTGVLSPELASAIKHMASYKKWAQISVKLPPGPGRAFERAISNSCGLTVDHRVAYPRDEQFCEGPHCAKCKVGAGLVKVGFARQEDLVGLAAAGAGERHRRRLEESAHRLRKLFGSIDNRSRG